MSWNVCKFDLCESYTARPDGDYCETHRRAIGKASEDEKKQSQKRNTLIAKQREKAKQPRKTISKNPKDWSNTFLCSDGERVRQSQIDGRLKRNYAEHDDRTFLCEGCGATSLFRGTMMTHAHIISQARCKVIGKTELIWSRDNWFYGCTECNLAIENPKDKAWKQLKNIDKCLSFIKLHDFELYSKFELSSVNQETKTI